MENQSQPNADGIRDQDLTQTSEEEPNNVTSVVTDLQNPNYHNWIKGQTTLMWLNEGAQQFLLVKIRTFIKGLPELGAHFDSGEYITKMCADGVKWVRGKWKYPESRRHCLTCKTLFDIVIQNAMHHAGFLNCKDKVVPGALGIAKLFLPKNCWMIETVEESDTQALFQLFRNCRLFSDLSIDTIDKIIEVRNKMTHTSTLTITDGELKELFDSELIFIEEAIKELGDGDENVRGILVSSKDNIEKFRTSEIAVGNILEVGNTAMKYVNEELAKQMSREDKETIIHLQEQQQLLQSKMRCYRIVEKSPIFIHFQNLASTNTDEINKVRSELQAEKQTNNELRSELQVKEQTHNELRRRLQAEEETSLNLKQKFEYAKRELRQKLCWICYFKHFLFIEHK